MQVWFVLLHNGNKKPSIPIAYGVGIKEEYEMVSVIIDLILYTRYQFKIVADSKVIAILMGLQSGYTAFSCHLCLWHSRKDDERYTTDIWPPRTQSIPGEFNVKSRPLVSQDMIILPPLHIELRLVKNFVKALDPTIAAFEYLNRFFPKLSTQKIKQGIFIGPLIRDLLKDTEFEKSGRKESMGVVPKNCSWFPWENSRSKL